MKKILTISFSILTLVTFAQVPQGLSYQAVVRDTSSGLPKKNTTVTVKFTILQGSDNGTPVYSETHATQTNEFGLFTLIIGQGITTDTFSNIDWATDLKFLKIEIDNQLAGTPQLWSVPYALFAGNGSQWKSNSNGIYYDAGNVGIGFPANSITNGKFAVNGNITSSSDVGGAAGFVVNGLQSDASYLLLRGHQGSLSHITSSWSIHRAGFDKNKLIFRYGETQFNPVYLAIDTTGKVGIGTANPVSKLDVNGTTRTRVLEILGNDRAELCLTVSDQKLPHGSVVVFDELLTGKIRLSNQPYDKKRAGVITESSGKYRTGILHAQEEMQGGQAVALDGTVEVLAIGPIAVGDDLTSSAIPGYAMLAKKRRKSMGVIIGKAIQPLAKGVRGMVAMKVEMR